jgi:hypothetical protein
MEDFDRITDLDLEMALVKKSVMVEFMNLLNVTL